MALKPYEPKSNTLAVLKIASGKVLNTLSLGMVAKSAKDMTIVSSAKNPTVNKVLTTVANKPAQAALVPAAAAAPAAAASLVKSGASAAGSAFAKASTGTKVATVLVAPTAVGILSSSKKARESISNYPSAASNFGRNVGGFIDQPSVESAKKVFRENPGITSAALAGGAFIAGKTAIGAASAIATNTAVRANTSALEQISDTKATPLIPAAATSAPVLGDTIEKVGTKPAATAAVTPTATSVAPAGTTNNYRQTNKISIRQTFKTEKNKYKVVQSYRNGKRHRA